MSGVCLGPIHDNEPVSKRKIGNDYAAPKFPESPEAPKEDATMAGQGATAKQISISLRCKDTAKQSNLLKRVQQIRRL